MTFSTLQKIRCLAGALTLSLVLPACLNFKNEKAASNQVPMQPTYASLRQNLFKAQCITCHNGPSSPHGIDLSSYQSILHGNVFPPLVIPGSPERSSLYKSCDTGQMPKNGSRLHDATMSALYQWIKNGAKETEDTRVGTPTPTPSPHGEPGDDHDNPTSTKEPCDVTAQPNEPGVIKCSSEPGDD
jgi:hypothetical protein